MIAAWIEAIRLRTLPLALASIGMGSVMAASQGLFQQNILILAAITTILLQILSNLANDLGDSDNGADHTGRIGPARAVQSGAISKRSMLMAVILFAVLSLISGIALLYVSVGFANINFIVFLLLGIACIVAAIKYTAGANPYGYAGLGDISVFLFFGLVGVLGSYYLYSLEIPIKLVLPAISCGMFATAVLNLNNMRDIDSDKIANKQTIPVRIGLVHAKVYHFWLVGIGAIAAMGYAVLYFHFIANFLFVIALGLFAKINSDIQHKEGAALDPYLKKTAMTTLLFVLLWGVGIFI